MVDRRCLNIFYNNPKIIKELNEVGNIVYTNKKKKYIVMFIDNEILKKTLKKLKNHRNVKKVSLSLNNTDNYIFNE